VHGAPSAPKASLHRCCSWCPWLTAVARFGRATGTRVGVIESYTPFGAAFDGARACAVEALGALSLIQWNPGHARLADIVAGRWDRYLASYARAVREFGNPIILAFAHEMNGHWFSWGYTHTSPAVFIAAWRHVHRVVSAAGARNIIWLWNVNRDIHRSHPGIVSPPGEWWPGRAYVDWVGIDAYFNTPADTFGSVFDVTLDGLQRFTHAPVLITETAVGPNPGRRPRSAACSPGCAVAGRCSASSGST
jgi:mannan endo-1,4-beta-mannosidase